MHEQSTGRRWQSPPSWHMQEPTTVMPSQGVVAAYESATEDCRAAGGELW